MTTLCSLGFSVILGGLYVGTPTDIVTDPEELFIAENILFESTSYLPVVVMSKNFEGKIGKLADTFTELEDKVSKLPTLTIVVSVFSLELDSAKT